jgi:ketosteroid isomerase-like protein
VDAIDLAQSAPSDSGDAPWHSKMETKVSQPITLDFIDRFAAAWNRHDVDAIVSMMTPDGVMYASAGFHALGRRLHGREELRIGIAEILRSMPDARWNGAKHFVAGDRGVTEWVFTATRPHGSKVDSPGCDVFTFRDALIAIKNSFRKHLTY